MQRRTSAASSIGALPAFLRLFQTTPWNGADPLPEPVLEHIRDLFPKAEIDSIPDAGHWVHAEQPAAFLERVRSILG